MPIGTDVLPDLLFFDDFAVVQPHSSRQISTTREPRFQVDHLTPTNGPKNIQEVGNNGSNLSQTNCQPEAKPRKSKSNSIWNENPLKANLSEFEGDGASIDLKLAGLKLNRKTRYTSKIQGLDAASDLVIQALSIF